MSTRPQPPATAEGRSAYQDSCGCFDQGRATDRRRVAFHAEQQDTSAPGWLRLLELVEEAAADGREEFHPLRELAPGERRQIVTLPPTIARLTAVREFGLYGSNLVRIPPEIGAMASLESFDPYTSYRLHWFPYELTRCPLLRGSRVSIRALYGNKKVRPPFPPLDPRAGSADTGGTCSVCDGPITRPRQVWISLQVATDVLPLLVNACSRACVAALPSPPAAYVRSPHSGGPALQQPTADHW
ncbi:leucine-rich repeat domain-containing protein [Kitasatospora sp. NBC_00240]|uniref:leucine-rich repeat domain-containing protein n=1 Tax=Kitasatospora sp. NBC_00240 TaxID=2903567 RepID=UPI002258392C|nr:leucine-rich repeat domain-containing protein [Kitasatospora sp. NBC_00240]MCX5215116.1 leucine-rich repeat domain-containing protein [Kitasatospora sp. NBC_00240]